MQKEQPAIHGRTRQSGGFATQGIGQPVVKPLIVAVEHLADIYCSGALSVVSPVRDEIKWRAS